MMFMLIPVSAYSGYNKNIIKNGGFENDFQYWNCLDCDRDDYDIYGIYYDEYLRTNQLWLGINSFRDEEEYVYQSVSIPADADKAIFSFDLYSFEGFYSGDQLNILVTESGTSNILMYDTFDYDSIGDIYEKRYKYNLKNLAGRDVDIYFNKIGGPDIFIDNVKFKVATNPVFGGTVWGADGRKLKGAQIVVKYNGKKIWNGKTSRKGKFSAKGLSGTSDRVNLTIRKNGKKEEWTADMKWGKKYNHKIHTEL